MMRGRSSPITLTAGRIDIPRAAVCVAYALRIPAGFQWRPEWRLQNGMTLTTDSFLKRMCAFNRPRCHFGDRTPTTRRACSPLAPDASRAEYAGYLPIEKPAGARTANRIDRDR